VPERIVKGGAVAEGKSNLTRLPSVAPAAEEPPVPLGELSAAVRHLNDLGRYIQAIDPGLDWSIERWRTAAMPLILRLPAVERSLTELARVRLDDWPDPGWAVRVATARGEVERRLREVSRSMRPLVDPEAAGSVVAGGDTFNEDGARLVAALERLCRLIAWRYPEAI
jgi:hypothetical protein